MIDPALFPNATKVAEVESTPENRALVAQIVGPVKSDWSNAIMLGHPVYVIDGHTIAGYTPKRNALTGRVKTTIDADGDECILSQLTHFEIPDGHPWKEQAA